MLEDDQKKGRGLRKHKVKMRMYDMYEMPSAKVNRLEKHYLEWFASFESSKLFRIYDLASDDYIKSSGPEGTYVMNKVTLSKTIAKEQARDVDSVKTWIAIFDSDNIDFSNPVFIGTEDLYYGR